MNADITMEAAQFAADAGDPSWARSLFERVLSNQPDHEAAQALLTDLDSPGAE